MSKTFLYMTTVRDILERTLNYNLAQLKHLPKGTLITNVSKGFSYLYWSRASKKKPGKRDRTPLKEADRELVNQLRRQRIMRVQIPLLKHNIKVVDRFLMDYKPCDESTCLLALSDAYRENLDFQGFDAPQKNMSHPENLAHKNSIGEVFRSRIEVQISELLLSRGIKYDYDTTLIVNNKLRSPDFRITHPKTGEFIYIEYFGKMVDEEYGEDNLEKIRDYLKAGYTYGKDLMFIFENTKGIDLAAIAHIIDMQIA